MNKKLVCLILVLIPFTFFYFNKKEEEKTISVMTDNKLNQYSLDDYLVGVVAAEMPASFHLEALKAQAVASRTYTLKMLEEKPNYVFKGSHNDQGFITVEKMQQKWQEQYEHYFTKVKEAVLSTSEVITYNDKLIKAYYFSLSNGNTENAIYVFGNNEPYLKGTNSQHDLKNSNITKTFTISRQSFCESLSVIDCKNITINNIVFTSSNRVKKITINNVEYKGIDIRKKLNLRSTDFIIVVLNDDIEITTKGYGHGVGMSQYGANYMAKEGYTYQEILNHYYPKTILTNY